MLGKPQLIQPRKKLKVPNNIILMFQPPHCRESNAIEQVGSYLNLKRGRRWNNPACLDDLRALISQRLEEMTEEVIASITGRTYVLTALSVVDI